MLRLRVQEEAYVILSGSGRIRLDDEVVELAKWDVVRVAPEDGERDKGRWPATDG